MCFYFLFFLHFSSTKSYLMRETETHSPHPVNFPEWHSCVQPGDAFLPLTTERHAKGKKGGQLTCSVQDEDAERGASLSASKPRSISGT